MNLDQEKNVREGVEKFYTDIFVSENISEIQIHINKFLELTYRYAAKKNNRPNKGLKVFTEYANIEDTPKIKVKKQITKKTYKDYLPHFLILHKRGYSYRKISRYAQKELNIKVSNETIRKKLQEIDYVQ